MHDGLHFLVTPLFDIFGCELMDIQSDVFVGSFNFIFTAWLIVLK